MKNYLSYTGLFLLMLSGCGGSSASEGTPIIENLSPSAADTSQANINTIGEVTFISSPSNHTQEAFAHFEFSADNAEGYQCKIDQQAFETCNNTETFYPISLGDHQLTVRGIQSNGNNGPESSVSWTVDNILGDTNFNGLNQDLIKTNVEPSLAEPNSWRGIFRINCDFAHSSYNDPIVFPDQENAAHLHRFYGNMLVDHATTLDSLFTQGESSCQGNKLNRSSYWVPALLAPAYDQTTGERLLNNDGSEKWQAVPAVVGNDDEAHEIFYYSAGVDDLTSIQPIPLGLKMIAGSNMGQPGQEQSSNIVRWHCQSWDSSDAYNPHWSSSIPACIAPDRLRMDIFFPSCWNGKDLDSSDHKSHMAYPLDSNTKQGMICPDSHPVPIIRVSFHYAFGVKPEVYDPITKSSVGWRLASDMYDVDETNPGGMSLHGDWFNAWHPQALEAILTNCIQKGLDCHDGNLAIGVRLSGTQPGSQIEPEVINQGKGY